MVGHDEKPAQASAPGAEQDERVGAPGAVQALCVFDAAVRVVFYLAFPGVLALLAWTDGLVAALVVATVLGAGFGALSVVRKRIDAPRPFEELGVEPLLGSHSRGRSFPSRHLFSCAAISTSWVSVCLPVAVVLGALSVAEAFVRVIGGLHYPRDVVAGIACGVATGALALASCAGLGLLGAAI